VLARSGDEASVSYLREVLERDPSRTSVVAMGLAQLPGDDQWQYLVRSLPSLEGVAILEVVRKLAQSERVPDEAEHYRNLIDLGQALQGEERAEVVQLLQKWSGEKIGGDQEGSQDGLAAWQHWFAQRYPDHPSLQPVAAEDERPAANLSRQPGGPATR
jgi:hypothetical protein